MESIVGRHTEQDILQKAFDSGGAELIAVYGRRRVGKTFLVRHFFEPKSIFCEVCGLKDGSLKDQLAIFSRSFQKIFPQEVPLPPLSTWRYAFELLTSELKKIPESKKVVIFFDELPWLVTPRSKFLQQLDHFWNTEWCKLKNVKIVLCGSAASWMIEKILHAKGGLHNRLSRTIRLQPFTLSEAKSYLEQRKIALSEKQVLDLYMVLGGVPYYLEQVERGLSAAQNINRICFLKDGVLFDEFDRLYASLFKHSANHVKIIRAIAGSRQGISRNELIQKTGIPSGTGLNKYLNELEEAGFIASFIPYGKSARSIYYRIIDEYSCFYLKWIKQGPRGVLSESDHHYWEKKSGTSAWQSWAGYAFEGICLKHAKQIKKALGIERIPAEVASWRYVPRKGSPEKGAQIDLLFDRGDGVVSICEIKYCGNVFTINKSYADVLKNKMDVFKRRAGGAKKHLFLVMITVSGVARNSYAEELVANEVALHDLFA